jgi:hypothetical protein
MDNPALAYIFLLDSGGRIRWRAEGYAEEEGIKEMKDHIGRLLREKDR